MLKSGRLCRLLNSVFALNSSWLTCRFARKMLHGTHREVVACLLLLVLVVAVTLYLTVFSLHGASAVMKIKIKSSLIKTMNNQGHVFDDSLLMLKWDPKSKTNYTIKYRADGTMPINSGEIHNEEEMQYHKAGMSNHVFNVLISDRIGPVSRPVPDTRDKMCRTKTYSNISLTASVIVCFHKEALSALLRTAASVVERTPPQLLQEVILVDDYSDAEEKTYELMKNVERQYPYGKVRLIQSHERLGLIKARIKGAKEATGDVLVFLDSHCEPNVGWIEPLLDLIQNNRKTIVCPIVDIINPHTLAYTASPIMRGGFNWGLHFTWEALPNISEDPSKPFMSPTMSGGLFAVDREYFKEIGYYDEEMKEWGAENLELSFRTWMCGGQLLFAPCSRVGHIFRKRRPHAIPEVDNPTRNAARLSSVWLDQYSEHFLNARKAARKIDFGDVTDRKRLRRELKCQNFSWFLSNVYPEIEIPGERESKIKFYRTVEKPLELGRGMIKVSDIDLCIRGGDTKGSLIVAETCQRDNPLHIWRWTDFGELKMDANPRLCMDASTMQFPSLSKCDASQGTQKWEFLPRVALSAVGQARNGRLFSVSAGLCLQLSGGDLSGRYELSMRICKQPTVQIFKMETV